MDHEQPVRHEAALITEPVTPKAGKGTRIGATIVVALIFTSLLWYFAADRLTPHSFAGPGAGVRRAGGGGGVGQSAGGAREEQR